MGRASSQARDGTRRENVTRVRHDGPRQDGPLASPPCRPSISPRACRAWGPRPPSRSSPARARSRRPGAPSSTSRSASPASTRRPTSSTPPSARCATATRTTCSRPASPRRARRSPTSFTATRGVAGGARPGRHHARRQADHVLRASSRSSGAGDEVVLPDSELPHLPVDGRRSPAALPCRTCCRSRTTTASTRRSSRSSSPRGRSCVILNSPGNPTGSTLPARGPRAHRRGRPAPPRAARCSATRSTAGCRSSTSRPRRSPRSTG